MGLMDTKDPTDLGTYPSFLIGKDGIPVVSEMDWQLTPKAVRLFVLRLHALVGEVEQLRREVDRLKGIVRSDSSNSSKPPSSDSPYTKGKSPEKPHGKRGAKKGHTGHRQAMLDPTETRHLRPTQCPCGNREFPETAPYYTHQVIELPEIKMEVTHFVLYKGHCPCCGKLNKALIPKEHRCGYGSRLTAMIGEMAGNQGESRTLIQGFCSSVLGFSISLGAIQKLIDRVTKAIEPHYERIAQQARKADVNHVDETSWFQNGVLMWLWVMVSSKVALFMIHSKRSKAAFDSLIQDWRGILVSDGYGLYRKWVGLRQSCLAHLIRNAKALGERSDPEIAAFGHWATAELQRLCHMAHAPPTVGQWGAFYARLIRLISTNIHRKDEAGKFARRLLKEMDSLWVFLYEQGVSPTNNFAERIIRFAVIWRKRSFGTASEKGNRWVERILSLRQTCRLHAKATFPVLVDALNSYFQGTTPDLAWIGQHSTALPQTAPP
ncbi:MAG: IS66 family transposase [Thermodesulfobacteriota bacterium]